MKKRLLELGPKRCRAIKRLAIVLIPGEFVKRILNNEHLGKRVASQDEGKESTGGPCGKWKASEAFSQN